MKNKIIRKGKKHKEHKDKSLMIFVPSAINLCVFAVSGFGFGFIYSAMHNNR